MGVTAIEEITTGIARLEHALGQHAPNPFNPTTVIEFDLPAMDHVIVEVFNTIRQQVAMLHVGALEPGMHRMTWDGKNALGEPCAAGVYVYTARTSQGILSRKMLLLK